MPDKVATSLKAATDAAKAAVKALDKAIAASGSEVLADLKPDARLLYRALLSAEADYKDGELF